MQWRLFLISHVKPLILLIMVQTMVYAANIVAVLEIVPADDEVELTLSQYRHLTDELRNRARITLPEEFSILTRDNIISLLPQDEEEQACLAEGCAVDIGRAIGADYVTQGQIRMFDGKLTLTVELFSSMNGNLLGSFVTESENATGLLNAIRENASPMFEKLSKHRFSGLKDLQDEEKAKPEQLMREKKDAMPVAPSPFRIGVIAKGGFTVSGIYGAKNGLAYSVGLVTALDIGLLDLVSGALFSRDGFEFDGQDASILKAEVPLTAMAVYRESFGLSLGAVLSLPLSAKIDGKAVEDLANFGVAATGGFTYLMTKNIFANAFYEKYFTKSFSSINDSTIDRGVFAVGYLF